MRTTVRIDDDVFRELKEQAHKEGISMAKLFDRAVRLGLQALKNGGGAPRKPYKEKTYSMGVPLVDLTKANQVYADLLDEDFINLTRRLSEQNLGK
jgi:hypothetical protein